MSTIIQISPFIPVASLLVGAGLVTAGVFLRFRWLGAVSALTVLVALAALVLQWPHLPITQVVFDWRPVTLLGATASLRVDRTAWLFELALLAAGAAVALKWAVMPTRNEERLVAGASQTLTLFLLAAGVTSVSAANIVTVCLCWGMLDGLFCAAILIRGGPGSGRRAQLALGLNGLATLAVWCVAMLLEQARLSPYWHLLVLPPMAQNLMGLAAALRLGLYPLHLWETGEHPDPERALLLYMIPAMAGLALWARLSVIEALPSGALWMSGALLTALLGGLQAWAQADPRESIPYLALGYGGMLILSAIVGSGPAAWLATGALSWLLGLTLLVVGRPLTRAVWPLAIPTLLGAATLAGLPLTLGFPGRAALYNAMSSQPMWLLVSAFFAEALLVGALIRCCLAPETSPVPRGPLNWIGHAAAACLAMAPVLVLGINPALVDTPVMASMKASAWIGWGAPIVGAVALTLGAKPIRARLGDWGRVMGQALGAERWYSVLLPLIRLPARLGNSVSDVLQGDGAFLWTLIILMLVLYLRRSTG